MVFGLEQPEMTRVEEIVVPPVEADETQENAAPKEEVVIKRTMRVLPPEWENSFGMPITSIGRVSLLEQIHFSGEWDILRAAKEL